MKEHFDIMILLQEKPMVANISDRWKFVWQLIFVLALCVAAIAILLSLGVLKTPAGGHRVQFRVEASGGFAIITLDAKNASIAKPTTVTVPWTKTLQIPSGTQVYLTASNPTQKLTCTIRLDNDVWKTDTTAAPKDGVACAGIVP
jgi:hypothetical protein